VPTKARRNKLCTTALGEPRERLSFSAQAQRRVQRCWVMVGDQIASRTPHWCVAWLGKCAEERRAVCVEQSRRASRSSKQAMQITTISVILPPGFVLSRPRSLVGEEMHGGSLLILPIRRPLAPCSASQKGRKLDGFLSRLDELSPALQYFPCCVG
jgi:hypothetical protein